MTACESEPEKSNYSDTSDYGEDSSDNENCQVPCHSIKTEGKDKNKPLLVTVSVEGKPLRMEIDTGSAVSVISEADFSEFQGSCKVNKTGTMLKTYTGELISPIGVTEVKVQHNRQNRTLRLYVVQNGGVPLLGREWLHDLKLDWKDIKSVTLTQLDDILKAHKAVFSDTLGTMKDIKAKLHVKENATPVFRKARPIPYALQDKVNADIDRLVDMGVLSPVEYSEWATPIVPVVKKDHTVRICGDFKTTVNPVLEVDIYPQPRREDLFASLAGGQKFSKLDMSNAYLQMEVDEESRQYLTINTTKGLFVYNRLVFGIASAPAIFQRSIEQILHGIPGICIYQDDILVTGCDENTHLSNLKQVLQRLEQKGLRLKEKKCKFFVDSLEYLGHRIDKYGIHTVTEKVDAIVNAPAPSDVSQLRSFLGMMQYYSHFIENLSSVLAPLNKLLTKNIKWSWTPKNQSAFDQAKQLLVTAPVLVHYDPKLPLRVACDASPFGIGSVLSHLFPDGSEHPIAYASRTLTDAEKNYAQIDREALSIVWGIRKFNDYLFGQRFTIVTDNRPLSHIFAPKKDVPSMAAARIQRWALYLGGHDYTIQFRPTGDHGNADGLSRLPLTINHPDKLNSDEEDIAVFSLSQVELLPTTAKDIARETCRDPILSKVYEYTLNGWNIQNNISEELRPYYDRQNEISLSNGCLMWGIRVIIPTKYRDATLDQIHEGHLGIVKMKSIARSHVYWPHIDDQIEQKAKRCSSCSHIRNVPARASLHPWEWPHKPWQRIHMDFAGPFLNHMFLIIVDAHSKWPEVIPMKVASSTTTINALRDLFARYGLVHQIVTDNGSQFTSEQFQTYMKANNIRHITSAVGHPSTNGLAERLVQSFKTAMKSAQATETTIGLHLSRFLMAYRNASHSTTQVSPASLLIGRPLRSLLDLLKPSPEGSVLHNQSNQIMSHQSKFKDRHFEEGDTVLARDYRANSGKWFAGKIVKKKRASII